MAFHSFLTRKCCEKCDRASSTTYFSRKFASIRKYLKSSGNTSRYHHFRKNFFNFSRIEYTLNGWTDDKYDENTYFWTDAEFIFIFKKLQTLSHEQRVGMHVDCSQSIECFTGRISFRYLRDYFTFLCFPASCSINSKSITDYLIFSKK